MWIVFLNSENESDANRWGLNGVLAAAARSEANNEVTVKKVEQGIEEIEEIGAWGEFLVLNTWRANQRNHRAACARLLASCCTSALPKIWIHFGGANSDAPTVTRGWVRDHAKTIFATAAWYSTLNGGTVNPFSMTSRTRWDRQLQELAPVFRGALERSATDMMTLPIRLRGLGDAWHAASGYYETTKPLTAWLAAVFPLYLDLTGLARDCDATRRKAWWDEALAAYQRAKRRITSDDGLHGTTGVLERAATVLNATADGRVRVVLEGCRTAAALLQELEIPSAEIPSPYRVQEFLKFSELLRLLEQHYAA